MDMAAAIDATSRSPTGTPLVDNEEQKKQAEKENKQHEELEEKLKEEAPNERVYKALENFLLADPNRQIEQLGGAEGQLKEGDEARAKGELQVARGNYETAAKVEIYKQNKDEAKKYIALADEVTETQDTLHLELHKTLFSNMDEVMRIAKDYYDKLIQQQQQQG